MTEAATESEVYGTLSDVDVQFLRRTAMELRAKLRRTVAEVLESAKLLAAARRRLDRGNWRVWLAREAQIPLRSAHRLVNVGTAFAHVSEDTLLNFTPTALYTLAEPGVPQAVREHAIAQARDGEEVTAAKVVEWARSFSDRTDGDDAPLRLARPVHEDAEPVDPFTDPAEVYAVENWKLLCDLVGSDGTVHISASTDTEAEDMTVVSGYSFGGEGKRRTATGPTVESVILKLTETERKKECSVCGALKSLEDFCRRADMPDGREYRCKACERARVRAYTKAKAAG